MDLEVEIGLELAAAIVVRSDVRRRPYSELETRTSSTVIEVVDLEVRVVGRVVGNRIQRNVVHLPRLLRESD